MQCGPIGLHTVWPNLTNRSFSSSQYLFGTSLVSCASVSSGFFVCTNPSLLEMRWTWVSTGIAGLLNA